MSNKSIGTSAKELVLLFYDKTGLRFTNRDIMIAIKGAKSLLNAGYTYDEIKETIVICFLLFIKSFKFIKTGITRIKL